MIKNIIKRDGRTEPYIPSKLNSWGKWAAKSLGNKVDWSSVVIDAVSEMPENVSSSALQEKLIQNCLDKSTWSYYLMAGRLYAAHLHKTIFPNGIPTVKEAHDELVRVGLMVDLGYDALDYQEIESFIDHEKDFETPHFTLHYIRQKYSLRDKVKRIEYETQQFVYMRMAMALARNERPDQRIDFVKRYYDKFSSKQMSAPTPNFVNLGTKKQGLISCFPAGSKVRMETGVKNIEDIIEGELVYTHKNRLRKVLGTRKQEMYSKFVYINTTASFNEELIPTENHPIYAIKRERSFELLNTEDSKIVREWTRADNLRIGDYIKLVYPQDVDDTELKIFDVAKESSLLDESYVLEDGIIKRKLKYDEGGEARQPDISNINIKNPDFFRLFGYYLSQGSLCRPTTNNSKCEHLIFTFNTDAKEHIADTTSIIQSVGGRAHVYESNFDHSTKIVTSSKPLVALIDVLFGRGFDKKKIDQRIMLANPIIQEELLSGMIRGDGCAYISGFTMELHNVELIRQVRDIGLRCKLSIWVTKGKKLKPAATAMHAVFAVNVSADEKFAQKVGKNLHKMRSSKRTIGKNILYLKDGAYGRVRLIHPFYNTDTVYDLMVEEDESFSVNGVAVHNCNLYTVKDSEPSLAVGDHIAYRMTAASAGIGSFINIRSKGNPVRGGFIEHLGKLPAFASLGKAVLALMQGSRGGAVTTYFSAYDPEVETIMRLRNQRSTENKKNRDLHYAMLMNKFLAKKALKNENAFYFNTYTAPDLMKALFSGDEQQFVSIYEKYEKDPTFKKEYFNPRDNIVTWFNEGLETGVAYVANIDEINRHTPFKEIIHSSNLCLEITEPTVAYDNMPDLYSEKEVGYVTFTNQFGTEITLNYNDKVKLNDNTFTWVGNLKVSETFFHESYGDNVPITIETIVKVKEEPEVALCALGAIPYDHIDEDDDEAYFEAMYLTLKMIDYCIYNNTYVLPHIKVTAQARMNAGVGLCGVATHMARKKLRYDTKEGLEELHRVAERHMYMAIKASLKIAKERGSAPWIHKTKWIDGWLPIDTANKAVESLGNFQYRYDWESLREEIKANGGIGHSCLVAYMPSESSSKSLQSTNSVYPVRDVVLGKTDNSITINWAAPDSDDKSLHYHSAWDVNEIDMIKAYAVMQKFVDQTISADLWRRVSKADKVPSTELLNQYFNMVKYGMKTRYYYNSNVSNGVDLTTQVDNGLSDKTELTSNVNDGPDCEGCSM